MIYRQLSKNIKINNNKLFIKFIIVFIFIYVYLYIIFFFFSFLFFSHLIFILKIKFILYITKNKYIKYMAFFFFGKRICYVCFNYIIF